MYWSTGLIRSLNFLYLLKCEILLENKTAFDWRNAALPGFITQVLAVSNEAMARFGGK